MKKILTFIMSVVLAFGAIGLFACNEEEPTKNSSSTVSLSSAIEQDVSVKGVSIPVFGAKVLNGYMTKSGQTGISKRLSATVEPANAVNKAVDYSLFWTADAEKIDEPVSDYVVIEQDSDGSLGATITCVAPFGDDVMVAQVTTRDGGYTAECVVTYVGIISEMSITSPTLNTVNTAERGDYYELFTSQIYTFNISLDNALHSVGTYDLSVSTGGVGEFYFCYGTEYRTVQYGPLAAPSNFEGWFAYANSDSVVTEQYNLSDISNRFISATLNGTEITVVVNSKALSNYYEKLSDTNRRFVYIGDEPIYTSVLGNSQPYEFNTNAKTINATNLPSAYFTLTVRDSVSNMAETIKLWVISGVDSVSLSTSNIEF